MRSSKGAVKRSRLQLTMKSKGKEDDRIWDRQEGSRGEKKLSDCRGVTYC
jgi:hypothetical protein